jgi:hypothetical protein
MSEAYGRFGTNGWGRLFASVLALVVLLLVVPPEPVWAQQTTAAGSQSSRDMPTLGATEQVVLVNEENGEEVETLGRIDTGAFYTSIG